LRGISFVARSGSSELTSSCIFDPDLTAAPFGSGHGYLLEVGTIKGELRQPLMHHSHGL
jgi:hypothetical protein